MLGREDAGTIDWSERFARLFEESYVDYASARISYVEGAAPGDLVTRLHLVAVTDDGDVVLCRDALGGRFLPGGTRERDESLHALARRELVEEAGAVLSGELVHFSAHRADSDRAEPYRAHFPHPRTLCGYAVGRVRVTGPPSNPPDGEDVVEVLTLPPRRAADYLAERDRLHADVLRHAEALGLVRGP